MKFRFLSSVVAAPAAAAAGSSDDAHIVTHRGHSLIIYAMVSLAVGSDSRYTRLLPPLPPPPPLLYSNHHNYSFTKIILLLCINVWAQCWRRRRRRTYYNSRIFTFLCKQLTSIVRLCTLCGVHQSLQIVCCQWAASITVVVVMGRHMRNRGARNGINKCVMALAHCGGPRCPRHSVYCYAIVISMLIIRRIFTINFYFSATRSCDTNNLCLSSAHKNIINSCSLHCHEHIFVFNWIHYDEWRLGSLWGMIIREFIEFYDWCFEVHEL